MSSDLNESHTIADSSEEEKVHKKPQPKSSGNKKIDACGQKKIINSIWFNSPTNGCSHHDNRFFIENLLLTRFSFGLQSFLDFFLFWLPLRKSKKYFLMFVLVVFIVQSSRRRHLEQRTVDFISVDDLPKV